MNEINENNKLVVALVENSLKIPGVKVNRREFLLKTFNNNTKLDGISIEDILEKGPIEAGVSIKVLDKISFSLIQRRTLQSTGASFIAGLPGGFAIIASIPADTAQYFAVTLHLAQELAYVYGYKDLILDDKKATNQLILFLGVMFGVSGAATTMKLVSESISKRLVKKLPEDTLSKTIYYSIIKNIAEAIGVRITKSTVTEGVSKVIPLIGGILSGGLTYISMKPMGNRLKTALIESINCTGEELKKDLNDISKIIDIDFSSVKNSNNDISKQMEEVVADKNTFSVADEILKFKGLLDKGIITQKEFDTKKQQLLSQ